MITGFAEQTKDLNEYELNRLLPAIVSGMKTKVGRANAIRSAEAIKLMKEKGFKLDAARFRKILHIIRVQGLVKGICGDNSGYFIANTQDEWTKYLTSINERLQHIQSLRDAITEQYNEFKELTK